MLFVASKFHAWFWPTDNMAIINIEILEIYFITNIDELIKQIL